MIFIHNRKAISNCLCQLSIMCDCDQCFFCFMKILQKFQKHILCFFIQSCKWFIQDQYFRIHRKDAGKRYFSFLPAAQMMGRAARNICGKVILYADTETDSIRNSVRETERRRAIQMKYNEEHGITPVSIRKAVVNLLPEELTGKISSSGGSAGEDQSVRNMSVADLEKMMWQAVEKLDFEKAARIRDALASLEGKEWNRVANDSHKRSKGTQSKKHRR